MADPAPYRSRLYWVAGLVLLLLVAGVVWWKQRALRVEVVQVAYSELVRTLQFSARVSTLSRVDIGSTVTGRVAQVLVNEGANVRQDQVLLQLESAQEDAALAQALAAQQQAAARLAGLRATGRSAARATQSQAQALLVAAQAELARVGQLVAQDFLSPSRLDEARRAHEVAQAQVAGAEAATQALAEAGSEIRQALAQLRLATAASDAARARLAQTRLLAPSDAQVLSRQVEPGQIVQPGRSLLVLALAGPTRIVAQVDERFLQQLAPGQPAWAVADAYAGQRFPVNLVSIAPLVDTQRGAVEVKFDLPGPPPAFLRQDMSLSLEVETARRARALVIPLAALVAPPEGANAGVRVVADGRTALRSVRLGLQTLDAVEILEGLVEGDDVLLDKAIPTGRRVRAERVAAQLVPARRSGAAESGAAALTNAIGR
ncbi:MAG: efflux RND transporter periplasmic adaptor subunit [Burkholderiaceae bacterium]